LNELSKPNIGSRINVTGTTGSGKTTAAHLIAGRLGLRRIEIDAMAWRPNWETTPRDELRTLVDEATQGAGWVIDGNYSAVRDVVWPKLDTIVWLDYRFPRVFTQLLLRTIRRSATREVLWNGCRERFRISFFSTDSILLWCIKTHWRRRRTYPIFFEQPEHAHIQVLRFRSPRQFRQWFHSLPVS